MLLQQGDDAHHKIIFFKNRNITYHYFWLEVSFFTRQSKYFNVNSSIDVVVRQTQVKKTFLSKQTIYLIFYTYRYLQFT